MACNKHVNHPPPYLNHSAGFTDAPNYQSNLLSRQHPNYGSVLAPREEKKSHILTKSLFFLLIATSLVIFAIFFYPAHDEIRSEWEAEEHGHRVFRDAWNSERKAITVEMEPWRNGRAYPVNRALREEEEKRWLIVWENILL